MGWTKDLFAEHQMKSIGAKFAVKNVDLSKINWEKSAENRARIGNPIDAELVGELVTALGNGAELPMPVLLENGRAHIVYGGNHRTHAAREAKLKTIPAYVVKSNDERVLNGLPGMLNSAPSRIVPRADRLIFARAAIDKGIMKVEEAAKHYTLRADAIYRFMGQESAREEIATLGVNTARLPGTAIDHLRRIKNTNVLKQASRLSVEARMTGEEAGLFVRDILKKKTEAQQIAVVAQLEETLGSLPAPSTSPSKATRRRSPGRAVKVALATLESHAKARTIQQWGFTDRAEKDKLIVRLEGLCDSLRKIIKRSR